MKTKVSSNGKSNEEGRCRLPAVLYRAVLWSFAAVVKIFRGSRVRTPLRGLPTKVGGDIKHITAHKGLHMPSSSLDDVKKPSTIEFC